MPKKTVVICDGCGAEKEEKDARDWMRIEFYIGAGQADEIFVDSWDCLGRYAVRRAKEQNPDHG